MEPLCIGTRESNGQTYLPVYINSTFGMLFCRYLQDQHLELVTLYLPAVHLNPVLWHYTVVDHEEFLHCLQLTLQEHQTLLYLTTSLLM